MKCYLTFGLLLSANLLFAQQNVRAWYAEGQVWVVWETSQPFPETYGIYKGTQPFTSTAQATVIGRPFAYEYLPGTFVQQTGSTNFTYKIPKPDGNTYTLAPGEALFVETVVSSGSAYYAVVLWGNTAVTAGVNRTQNPVTFTYDPVNDPVTCHLQLTNTLSSNHKANWYCLWVLGKQDHWAGRPDFPVMANLPKNGMPAMFIVSEALNTDTTGGKRIPATHWFHGGGGSAIQHTADKAKQFNIAPQVGISVSHNDDFPQKLVYQGDTVFSSARTQWFGWAKAHNPFDPGFSASPGDTIINYTQRRILWINNWLINHYRVDADRVALQGYSMGSGGASALGKLAPNLFSTVCAFNNGFRRVNEETITAILGSVEDNLPTNLRDANNQIVRMNEVMDMNTPISATARDLPLFRTWAGKTDNNDRMFWGPDLVAQYRKADSLGWGMQISWDERPHVYDMLGYHWIDAIGANTQTFRDNLAIQESFNSKQAFPAFFNHRLEAQNNNPGTGLLGINLGDGDNWGTWGGYHNWELSTLTDENGKWGVTASLTFGAPFANDNCPTNSLTADMAVRKPQQFKPVAGKTLQWTVKDAATGNVLQNGTTMVRPNGLVVLPQVTVYRDNIRRVRIEITDQSVAAGEPTEAPFSNLSIEPNPSDGPAALVVFSQKNTDADLFLVGLDGRQHSARVQLSEGTNRLPLTVFEGRPAGFYVVLVRAAGFQQAAKWVKH
ncbi:MAG: hypothetical protein ABMA02_17690 [Saprospiraceae bacterium]